jgi:hypothetical protein
MRAGWAYFVSFQQAAKDLAQLSQTRLTMPVLVIGGEKALEVTVVVLKDTGRLVLEERPEDTTDALPKFLQ